MNNVVLNETTSHKHLGLTISNTRSWIEHINNIAETAWSRLNLMNYSSLKSIEKHSKKCTLHLFVPIVTVYGITVLLMLNIA